MFPWTPVKLPSFARPWERGEVSLNSAISACEKGRRWRWALHLLHQELGTASDEVSYNAAPRVATSGGPMVAHKCLWFMLVHIGLILIYIGLFWFKWVKILVHQLKWFINQWVLLHHWVGHADSVNYGSLRMMRFALSFDCSSCCLVQSIIRRDFSHEQFAWLFEALVRTSRSAFCLCVSVFFSGGCLLGFLIGGAGR